MKLFTFVAIFLSTKLTVQDQNVLRLLHISAFHAKFEGEKVARGDETNYGIARIAQYVKDAQRESESIIYIDAMDWFRGSIWFSVHKQEICAAFANFMPIDVIGIGEEEINYGETMEARTENFVKYIKAISNKTILCANCEIPETSPLHDIIKKSYVHKTGTGLEVGVTGFVRKMLTRPFNQNVMTVSEDDLSAVQQQVAELKEKGIKVIIMIAHAQWSYIQQIGKNILDVDIVIGGHSHRLQFNGPSPSDDYTLGPYPEEVITRDGKHIPVVHVGTGGRFIGDMTLYFDDNGEVVNSQGSTVWLSKKHKEDEEALQLLETFKAPVEEKRKVVLGRTRVFLNHSCYWHECNLGNFIADGFVYHQATKYTGSSQYWTDMPIAILRGVYLSASIDPQIHSYRNITVAHVLSIISANENLVCLNMNGSVLRQAMEHAVSEPEDETTRRFVQVSGLHVVFDMSKNLNERVVSLKARCAECNIPAYEDVTDQEYYKVIMPSTLSKGYAGFNIFREIKDRTKLGSDVEMIQVYIKNNRVVETGKDERIIVLNKDKHSHTDDKPSKRRAPHTSGVIKYSISCLSYAFILCTFNLPTFFAIC